MFSVFRDATMIFQRKDIIHQLKSGNKRVFEDLYRFFFPKLLYFSHQYLPDKEDATNVVQEVFTELWDQREGFIEDTNIQAWLFTVTKNKSLKQIAKIRSARNYTDYLTIRQLQVNYQALTEFDTSDFLFEELQQKLEEALQKLSPQVRRVFEKSRFEDKKNREIAEDLGLTLKTVEAHITKSLKHLRVELKEYLPLIALLFFK